jgi:hypothetical protein
MSSQVQERGPLNGSPLQSLAIKKKTSTPLVRFRSSFRTRTRREREVEDLEEASGLSVLLLRLVPTDSSSLGAWIRDFFGHQLLLVSEFYCSYCSYGLQVSF